MITDATTSRMYQEYIVRDQSRESDHSQFQRRLGAVNTTVSPALYDLEQWQWRAIEVIVSLATLPQNWDGANSPSPVESARRFASELIANTDLGNLKPPEIGPESGGALQVNWWSGDSRELELHIHPNQIITFLKIDNDEVVDEGTFTATEQDMAMKLIAWLSE